MKVLAFGDSFVKMFLHCQPDVKHWKFKGKSVKGLVKQEDIDRKKIERQVRKTPSGPKILMFFGQVDFNYVRYYKVIKGEPPIAEQTFKKYVQWVSSLNNRKNVSIVSIFPTPIKKESVISSLVNKGSYLPEEQTEEVDAKILAEYERSAETWEIWNGWIQKYCKEYGVNNIRLFKQNYLEQQFYDISRLTIHLRYVPVLKLVKNYVDINFDAAKAQQIEKQYQKQKVDRITNSIIRFNNKELQTQQPKQKQESSPSLSEGSSQKMAEHPVSQKQPQPESRFEQDLTKVKNERKYTADLDTDTNLEKETEKNKQMKKEKEKDKDKDKKAGKKVKREKEKQKPKEKKKYSPKSEQSEDEGERFLQLTTKGKKRY